MAAAVSTTLSSKFHAVLSTFTATLSQDELEDFKLSTLDDLQRAVLAIQGKQASERNMKNLTRLRSFLEAMEQYDEVVKVFLNTSNVLGFVWAQGPVKYLLQVASTYAEAFNALLDAYQDIGESIPLFKQYEKIFKENPYMQDVLQYIYIDILEFHQKALSYFKQRMWKQLFHATWKTFRTRFSGILENLQRHKRLVESQANIVQFEEIQRLRTATEAQIRDMQEAELKNMQVTLRSWLSAASSDLDQENAATVRNDFPDTGRWVLRQDRIRAWYDPDSFSVPLLWLNGKPGAGKTVLASLLIEECRKLSTVCVAFFYCKHEDPQRNTFIAVARSILLQLSRYKKTLLSYLYDKACTSGEISLGSPQLAEELLEVGLKAFDKLYLVIDGIDECKKTEKKLISTWFQSMVNAVTADDPDSLRCLFISQADNETCKLFDTIPALKITSAHNEGDIIAFSTVWAEKIQKRFDLSRADTDSMVKTVSSTADGMFLYAKLVMHNLLGQSTRARLRKEMAPGQFPRGLDEAYARIIHRLFTEAEASDREDASKLLGWLVCAKRPLRWHEIQGAWSFDCTTGTFDYEEGRLRMDSKELCGSLVEIHQDGTIDFVHVAAKVYLLEQKLVLPATEELNFAYLCLGYLNLECFNAGISDTRIRRAVIEGHYTFMDYAVACWFEHLERCARTTLLDNPVLFAKLVGILRAFLAKHHTPTKDRPSLSKSLSKTLDRFDKQEFFEKLVDAVSFSRSQTTVNSKEPSQMKPLDIPDQIIRVRSIIEKVTAELDPQQKDKLRALYGPNLFKCSRMSCRYFHEGFVTIQERDRHFERHQRAYYCTYPGCHISLIGFKSEKDLMDHQTEYHQAVEDDSKFPWHQAPASINIYKQIRLGNVAAVETWMEQFGSNIEVGAFKHMLKVAIGSRNSQILNIILTCVPKNYFISHPVYAEGVLHSAINSQHEEALRVVLERVQDINDATFNSLVDKALAMGQDALALILLESQYSGLREAPDDRDRKSARRKSTLSSSYLTLAIRHGRIAVVQSLILNLGVSALEKDASSRTALVTAAEYEKEDIAMFLLETSKCDIGATGKPGETAAAMAARQGYEKIIRAFFPHEPLSGDVESFLKSVELRNAARFGDAERVRVLLERKDIKPDLVDRRGYTPLMLAAEEGHGSIVEQLLGRTDVVRDRKTNNGHTALHQAVYYGHESIVRLLLSQGGVDLGAETYFPELKGKGDALDIAMYRGNEAIIVMLDEHHSLNLTYFQTLRGRIGDRGMYFKFGLMRSTVQGEVVCKRAFKGTRVQSV